MQIKDKAILIQNIKTGDKKSIVKLYTLNNGLVTAFAATSKSPNSKLRISAILPLNLLEVEYIAKQNKEVALLTEARSYFIAEQMLPQFKTLSIFPFLNEVLLKVLKEQQSNQYLYNFLETTIISLTKSNINHSNFAINFLLNLTLYLGIEPQNNYSHQTPYFNCREGVFESVPLSYPMGFDKDLSKLFSDHVLNKETKYSSSQRQVLLDAMLAYYNFHIPNFGNLKSVEILREIVAV